MKRSKLKEILISIQPQWVDKILNGEKTIEIRKTMPKCELPARVYIYCTKGKILSKFETGEILLDKEKTKTGYSYPNSLNGKVVADFMLKEIDTHILSDNFKQNKIEAKNKLENILLKKACLNIEEVLNYMKGNKIYAWHIEDLIIYDEPKELREFYKPLSEKALEDGNYSLDCAGEVTCMDFPEGSENCIDCEYGGAKPLEKAPQSWFYVEERL